MTTRSAACAAIALLAGCGAAAPRAVSREAPGTVEEPEAPTPPPHRETCGHALLTHHQIEAELDAQAAFVPLRVPGIDDAVDVALDGFTLCVRRRDRSFVCLDPRADTSRPAMVPPTVWGAPRPITQPERARFAELRNRSVVSGESHRCAVGDGLRVHCTGENLHYQLGVEDPGSAAGVVVGVDGASYLSAEQTRTCAVHGGGRVSCWGVLQSHPHSDPSLWPQGRPTEVPLGEPARAVASGTLHTCALLASGRVACWGLDLRGQLGDGPGVSDYGPPVRVQELERAVALAASGDGTCAVTAVGRVHCWGAAFRGLAGADPGGPQ